MFTHKIRELCEVNSKRNPGLNRLIPLDCLRIEISVKHQVFLLKDHGIVAKKKPLC
jgi:hypothetical protein